MSNFGMASEAGEGSARKIYTGVENFKVTEVCPDHEALKEIFGENAKEDTYATNAELKDAEGNVTGTVPQIKVVMFVDNEDAEMPIKTRLTYFVTKQFQLKTDGTKAQYINLYGRTAWLTKEDATNPPAIITLTGAKGAYHFDTTGMRQAYRGEEAVISMLRNLLNLGSPDKAKDKSLVASQFSIADWDTMFAGNVKMLAGVIQSSPNKIGLLLGAKTVEGGDVYQDCYNRNTLRQYSKAGGKFDYLRRDVEGAQANGAFSMTDFGDPSYKLSEHLGDAHPTAEAAVSGFGTAPAPSFDAATEDAFKVS
jgi:hypothetical protein